MMRLSAMVLVGLTASSIAGCQTIGDVARSVSGTDDAAEAPETAASEIAPASPGAAVAPSEAPINRGLAGMTSERLRAAWGEPTLKRTEAGSELWQYAGTGCSLLIYFYGGTGGALIVSHAEAVPGGSDQAVIEACAQAAGRPSLKPVS